MGITDATAITTGGSRVSDYWARGHSCALHQTGTISCWGNNGSGQLGNGQSGENADSLVPVQVANIADATAITTGGEHSCALHQTGTISCWGYNGYGQLGNGQSGQSRQNTSRNDNSADSSVPVQVVSITDATAITASDGHSCALHQNGTISCWGRSYGVVPVQVEGITDATAITTGYGHSCTLREDGTISCWGNNEYGQLGNRTGRDSSVPMRVEGITDATAITASGGHSCALHQTGTISCWGNNSSGQLGSNNGRIPQFVVGFEAD